jgi:hypothetical protein
MDNQKGIPPILRWVLLTGCMAGLAALGYDKAHPHFLERLIGRSGIDVLGIGLGGYLIFTVVAGVRTGTISGTYSHRWRRSNNALMFWFIVVFNGVMGGLLGVGLAGDLFGVW